MQIGNRRPQSRCRPIGIAMPLNVRNGCGVGLAEGLWRSNWRFIGVETHTDLHLGRVVALEGR